MNKNGRYNPFLSDSVHYVMTIEQLHLVSRKIRGCQYIYFKHILLTIQEMKISDLRGIFIQSTLC